MKYSSLLTLIGLKEVITNLITCIKGQFTTKNSELSTPIFKHLEQGYFTNLVAIYMIESLKNV